MIRQVYRSVRRQKPLHKSKKVESLVLEKTNDWDGNGVELYRDRPREEWPRQPDGESLAMFTRPLDLQALLAEAE